MSFLLKKSEQATKIFSSINSQLDESHASLFLEIVVDVLRPSLALDSYRDTAFGGHELHCDERLLVVVVILEWKVSSSKALLTVRALVADIAEVLLVNFGVTIARHPHDVHVLRICSSLFDVTLQRFRHVVRQVIGVHVAVGHPVKNLVELQDDARTFALVAKGIFSLALRELLLGTF